MAKITDASLLDESHLQQLTNALEMIKHANRHLDMAEQAGLPVQELRKTLKDSEDAARRIKGTYFPGR